MGEVMLIEQLREITLLSIVGRVLLAIVIGGIIGLERGMKNQPAGTRTYMVVCLGACVVMMTNQYIYHVFQTGNPTRLGARSSAESVAGGRNHFGYSKLPNTGPYLSGRALGLRMYWTGNWNRFL